MPKVTGAQIGLYLKPQQPNKAGEYPIVIRIAWNGKKEKATGIRCRKNEWDARKEQIKGNSQNIQVLNAELYRQKSEVVKRKQFFEVNNIPYTINELLCEGKVENTLDAIVKELARERQWSNGTRRTYELTVRCLRKYRPDIQLIDINRDMVIGFARWLNRNGARNNTVRVRLAILQGICNFAFNRKMIPERISFDIKRKYQNDAIKRAITIDQLRCMRKYRDRIEDGARKYALSVYLLGYYFQGLALCDLMRVKMADLKFDSQQRIIYNTKRTKTNHPVNIVLDATNKGFWDLFEYFNERAGYCLINCIGKDDSVAVQERKIIDMRNRINWSLGRFAEEANMGLIPECELCDNFPEKLTYYSIRHSFATNYIYNKGNPFHLATLMGRSEDGISRYVKSLSSIDEIAKEKELIEFPD